MDDKEKIEELVGDQPILGNDGPDPQPPYVPRRHIIWVHNLSGTRRLAID